MLYIEDFNMRHYVGFSQIGSHINERLAIVSFVKLTVLLE